VITKWTHNRIGAALQAIGDMIEGGATGGTLRDLRAAAQRLREERSKLEMTAATKAFDKRGRK